MDFKSVTNKYLKTQVKLQMLLEKLDNLIVLTKNNKHKLMNSPNKYL